MSRGASAGQKSSRDSHHHRSVSSAAQAMQLEDGARKMCVGSWRRGLPEQRPRIEGQVYGLLGTHECADDLIEAMRGQ